MSNAIFKQWNWNGEVQDGGLVAREFGKPLGQCPSQKHCTSKAEAPELVNKKERLLSCSRVVSINSKDSRTLTESTDGCVAVWLEPVLRSNCVTAVGENLVWG